MSHSDAVQHSSFPLALPHPFPNEAASLQVWAHSLAASHSWATIAALVVLFYILSMPGSISIPAQGICNTDMYFLQQQSSFRQQARPLKLTPTLKCIVFKGILPSSRHIMKWRTSSQALLPGDECPLSIQKIFVSLKAVLYHTAE